MWQEALAKEIAKLRAYVDQSLANFIGWTLVSNATALGNDSLQTSDDSKGQRPAQRAEPFGFRSRAIPKARGLWLRLGSSNVLFIGVAPSAGFGPSDLDVGESAQYSSNSGNEVRCKKDGSLTAKGTTVNVNDGTEGAARIADSTVIGPDISGQPGTGDLLALQNVLDVRYVLKDPTHPSNNPLGTNTTGPDTLTAPGKITSGSSSVLIGG